MNTTKILEKIRNDKTLKNIFVGVFPIDCIPDVYFLPCAFIVNLDPSDSPGSHWVSLYFSKQGVCEYFDSYGRRPNRQLLEFISANAKSYIYNNICVQELWTTSCGQMCLYFLVWRCRGITFKGIINSMLCDDFIAGFVDSL
jgi:hypothetical protein